MGGWGLSFFRSLGHFLNSLFILSILNMYKSNLLLPFDTHEKLYSIHSGRHTTVQAKAPASNVRHMALEHDPLFPFPCLQAMIPSALPTCITAECSYCQSHRPWELQDRQAELSVGRFPLSFVHTRHAQPLVLLLRCVTSFSD